MQPTRLEQNWKTRTKMRTHCSELLVPGPNWKTRLTLDPERMGQISWQKAGTIQKLHQALKHSTGSVVVRTQT